MSVERSSLPARAGPSGQEKYFFEKTVDTFSNLWYSNWGSEMHQTKKGNSSMVEQRSPKP